MTRHARARTAAVVLASVVVLVMLLASVGVASAQEGTQTPTDTPSDGEITKEQVLTWYENETDLSQEQAQKALEWYRSNYEKISQEKRGMVNLYLREEANEQSQTATPTGGETSNETSSNSNSSSESQVTKKQVLEWAQQGKDLSREQAQRVFEWFNQNQGQFSPTGREIVQNWLEEQLTGAKSDQRNATDAGQSQSVFDFADNSNSEGENQEAETVKPAKEAIKDGEVRGSELPQQFEHRGERIFPNLRLAYEEWDGDHTTLILYAEQDMDLAINDAWLATAETDRPAPIYDVSLSKGYNVIQVPTVQDPRNEEYLSISNGEYIEQVSDPYKPFIRRISKVHIPAIAGGAIAGFTVWFVLFASFRKNRYRDRLVHVAEVLNMR